jgi:hypothetical protein
VKLSPAAALALLSVWMAQPALAQDAGPAPEPSPSPGAVHLCVTSGGDVVLSGESGTAITPSARISVRGPLVLGGTAKGDGKAPLGFGAEVELTGLPAETLNSGSLQNLKALELAVGVDRVIGRMGTGPAAITTALYVEAGFATVLAGKLEPREHYARWVAGGLRLAAGDNFFAAAIGSDQRLDGTYQLAALVSGQVAVVPPDKSPVKGVGMMLRGTAILGLQAYGTVGAKRDVARIGLVLGR